MMKAGRLTRLRLLSPAVGPPVWPRGGLKPALLGVAVLSQRFMRFSIRWSTTDGSARVEVSPSAA
jgi:hypothetical protein